MGSYQRPGRPGRSVSAAGLGGVVAGLAAAGLAALGLARAQDDEAVPLWKAARDGLVRVEAKSAGSFSQAELRVENLSGSTIRIDVNGSYLKPRQDREQPLALGLLEAGKGETAFDLPAHREAKVHVLSFCMAAHLASPGTASGFALGAGPATGDAERLVRYWRGSPGIDQGRIQTALWNGAPNPPADPDAPAASPSPEPLPDLVVDLPRDAKRVAVVAGRAVVLRETGELVRAEPGHRFEAIARDVLDFAEDAGAVHALVAAAEGGAGASRERRLEVVRADVESGAIARELAPAAGSGAALARTDHLLWAAEGGAVVARDSGLVLVTASERRALGTAGDRFVRASGGALVLAASGDRVQKLRARGGGVEVESVALPVVVTALAVAGDGAYALDAKGALLHFGADDRPVRVHHRLAGRDDAEALRAGRPCERVGRSLLAAGEDLVVETDLDRVVLRAGDAPVHLASAGAGARLAPDSKTGTLHVVDGNVLRRWDAERTAWVPVRFREAQAR